jgi:hypothetical protein
LADQVVLVLSREKLDFNFLLDDLRHEEFFKGNYLLRVKSLYHFYFGFLYLHFSGDKGLSFKRTEQGIDF